MSRTAERRQNPHVNDHINLRMLVFNGNMPANIHSVVKVEIFIYDQYAVTDTNPDGRRLVQTIDGSEVINYQEGSYLLNVHLEADTYVIGKYVDVWTIKPSVDEPELTIEQIFRIYPSIWYTAPTPAVFDFNFGIRPNSLRKGSKQYLGIEIIPNVPNVEELRRYYESMAIEGTLKITIVQVSGHCLPKEEDLRLLVEDEVVLQRDGRFAYYKLDTTDLEIGIYEVSFKLEMGENVYLSERYKIGIYA